MLVIYTNELDSIPTSIDRVGAGSSGPLEVDSATDSVSRISSSTLIFGTDVVVPFVCGVFLGAVVVPLARFLFARGFALAPLSTGTGGTFLAPLARVGVAGGRADACSVSSSASSSLNGVEFILLLLLLGFGISLRTEED